MALDFTSYLMNQKPRGDMLSPAPVGGAPAPTFGKFAQEKMGTMTPSPVTPTAPAFSMNATPKPAVMTPSPVTAAAPAFSMNAAPKPGVMTPTPVRPMPPATPPPQAPAGGLNRTPGSVSASFLEFARQRQAARDAAKPQPTTPVTTPVGTPDRGPLAGLPLEVAKDGVANAQAAMQPKATPPVVMDDNAKKRAQAAMGLIR